MAGLLILTSVGLAGMTTYVCILRKTYNWLTCCPKKCRKKKKRGKKDEPLPIQIETIASACTSGDNISQGSEISLFNLEEVQKKQDRRIQERLANTPPPTLRQRLPKSLHVGLTKEQLDSSV